MSNNDIYVENGYKNRVDYLKSLAEDYCVDDSVVFALASMLGRNEDFDGLVSALEDYERDEERLLDGTPSFNSILSICALCLVIV